MTITLYTLLGFIFTALIMAAIWFWRRPNWTGFAGRTLWDWVALLDVPLMVGFATVLINDAQQQLAENRAAEAAFQSYIDRMTALTLETPADAAPDAVNAIGRAQTVAVLRLVEGERAGRVLAFLSEMDLLRRFSVSLEGIDLAGAELKGIRFGAVDFERAALAGVDLEQVNLAGADFEAADLSGADLKGADLRGAGFERCDLAGADLLAADLRAADLSAALGLEQAQLARACYDASTALPPDIARASGASEGCAFEGELDDD